MNENQETVTLRVEPLPTYEELELKLSQANTTIANYRNRVVDYEYKVSKLTEWLDENWDDLEMLAEPIAEIFDIPNEKTLSVRLTIYADLEVTVPRNKTVDDLGEDDFSVEIREGYRSVVTDVESMSIDNIEVEEN